MTTTPKLLQVGPEVLESVLSLLNYSSVSSFNEDVETIKEWMKQQPHLPEVMDAKKIQNFLILNKGSVEKCKIKIDNYYTIRNKLPELFEHANPKLPYLKQVLAACYFVPLPKLTKDNYRISVYCTRDKHLMEKLDPIAYFARAINIQEIRLMEDITYGDIFVIDGKDIPFGFIAKITPIYLHKVANLIYKKVYSNRIKGVYIINAPYFMDKFLAGLKLILKQKVMDRIHVCQSPDFMIKDFGKEIIPRDYGGSEKSLQEIQDMVVERFHHYQDYFDKLDELRVDENLRPQKLIDDEVLGYYGNFKKLEVD